MRVCLFYLAFASLLPAAGNNALTAEEKAAGWQLLFDGKSFDNWEDPTKKNPPGDGWVIEDGCLKALDKPRIVDYLFTRDSFHNFDFAFEWKAAPLANGGVKYIHQFRGFVVDGKLFDRATLPADGRGEEWVLGFEYQIVDNERHPDGKQPTNRTGSLYGILAPSGDTPRPTGEWNESRIVVRDSKIEHWLNGKRVLEADIDSREFVDAVNAGFGATRPRSAKALTERKQRDTPIALQNHAQGPVWFRNLKIRRLP